MYICIYFFCIGIGIGIYVIYLEIHTLHVLYEIPMDIPVTNIYVHFWDLLTMWCLRV